MATLKETRTRISSVIKTRQVTSAMKMVSAAKLKKAQNIFAKFMPYTKKQQFILHNIASGLDEDTDIVFFKQPKRINKILLVSVSSNKGLCGAFNANVISATIKKINQYKNTGAEVQVYTIGKKVHQVLKKTETIFKYNEEIQNELTFEAAAEIANELMERFSSNEFDKIELIYNHSKSGSTQVVVQEDYLPIIPDENDETVSNSNLEYIFQPDKEEILKVLVPQMIRSQFYKILLDSSVAEHSARMIAMNQATDNAGDLLRELKLDYNKARQTAITNEILEIVSGAEALKKA